MQVHAHMGVVNNGKLGHGDGTQVSGNESMRDRQFQMRPQLCLKFQLEACRDDWTNERDEALKVWTWDLLKGTEAIEVEDVAAWPMIDR